ncbi:GNAT family N-acetyltransferase [Oerskovia sp. M15]
MASGKELPARIAAYVHDDDELECRLFEAAGFTPNRYYSTLRRDLTLPVPEVALGAGLRVVPWSPELDEATRLAHNDAFRDHWGSEPATPESWVHGRSMFAPEWSVLIVDDGPPGGSAGAGPLVVGYLMSGRYEQDWPVAGYSSGYTETLGVRRDYRGRKIAVALLSAGMAAYKAGGVEFAELDVDTENPPGLRGSTRASATRRRTARGCTRSSSEALPCPQVSAATVPRDRAPVIRAAPPGKGTTWTPRLLASRTRPSRTKRYRSSVYCSAARGGARGRAFVLLSVVHLVAHLAGLEQVANVTQWFVMPLLALALWTATGAPRARPRTRAPEAGLAWCAGRSSRSSSPGSGTVRRTCRAATPRS